MISNRFKNNLSLIDLSKNLAIAYAFMWGFIEMCSYFGDKRFDNNIKPYWYLFLLIGFLYSVYKAIPKSKFCFKIPNRDSSIILQIENSLKIEKSCCIIPINNTFIVNPNGHLNNSSSVLSQFVQEFYDTKYSNLQNEINIELKKSKYKDFKEPNNTYKIGTVIPIKAKNRNFYLLVNSILNKGGRSETNEEMLETSLNELWIYLSLNAGKENFVIPILGTGRGRIILTRLEVIKEIVLSFLASCSDRNFTDSLTICINPDDIVTHNLNIEEIVDWIKAKVEYSDFDRNTKTKGTNALN